MKKLILIILFALLLAGCVSTPAQTEPATEVTPATITLALYSPNENSDGLVRSEVQVDTIQEQVVTEQLIAANVLAPEAAVNALTRNGSLLTIDFNLPFQTQVCSYGTAGESLLIQSVVNTFLEAYSAESALLTVNGSVLESGHVVYDTPLTFTE